MSFLIIYKSGLLNNVTSFNQLTNSLAGYIGYIVVYVGFMLSMVLSTAVPIAGMSVVAPEMVVFVLSTIANIIGASILYLLGMYGGRKVIDYISQDKAVADKWSQMVVKKVGWVFIAILFPIAPDNLIFLLAGTARMPMKYFLPIVIIGKGAGILTTIYFIKLLQFLSLTTIIYILIGAVLIGIVYWFVYKKKRVDKVKAK